ncbi:hypothetical protein CEXT_441911 [Caerostris extrusa]|uniref:Uncharacterized protein n=1 Tax=Caerostris extrusa TaxID=172846 RepID=A0AAV4Y1T8_CAEEX|nr:hypothetical protein CEXT_441911 [Caerostris extrusa]
MDWSCLALNTLACQTKHAWLTNQSIRKRDEMRVCDPQEGVRSKLQCTVLINLKIYRQNNLVVLYFDDLGILELNWIPQRSSLSIQSPPRGIKGKLPPD